MANFCSTSITLVAPSNTLDLIESSLRTAIDEQSKRTEQCDLTDWMRTSGFPEPEIAASEPYGYISGYVRPNSETLLIDQEDRWSPHLLPIKKILEKLGCSEVSMFVLAIEPGCGVFESNDPDQYDHWLIRCDTPKVLPKAFSECVFEFWTSEELLSALRTVYPNCPENPDSLEKWIDAFEEEYEDTGVTIRYVEEVEI